MLKILMIILLTTLTGCLEQDAVTSVHNSYKITYNKEEVLKHLKKCLDDVLNKKTNPDFNYWSKLCNYIAYEKSREYEIKIVE